MQKRKKCKKNTKNVKNTKKYVFKYRIQNSILRLILRGYIFMQNLRLEMKKIL